MFACTECGSVDVSYDALVSVNTDELVSAFQTYFCPECDGECSIEEAEA